MSQGSHAIIDGRAVPITAAQWDAGLRHQPIGPITAHAARPAPTASAPAAPPAPVQTEAETRAKAAAFDAKMAVQKQEARAERRTANLQRIARHGGPEGAQAKAILADEGAAAGRKAEADRLAALPKTIAEAKGDVRAFGRANMERLAAGASGVKASNPGRASMEALVRQSGMVPKG